MAAAVIWVKSSHSSESANCVEVALNTQLAEVHVRNSRDRAGPWLRFTLAEWNAFTAGVAAGEFAPERLTPH
jgi:hypothetical protein